MIRNPHPTMTAPEGLYTDGDVGLGIPASIPVAAGWNAIQEELVNLVEGAGLTLDPAWTQVLEAVEILISRKGALRNRLINGAMDIWQRGVSHALGNLEAYTADRWAARADVGGGAGVGLLSRQTFTPGQTAVPGAPTYYLRFSQTVGASAGLPKLLQRIEGVHSAADGSYTVSGWIKADAAISATLRLTQHFGSGGSADESAGSAAINVTTSWAKFEHTFVVPTVSGKTIGAGDYLEVALDLPGSGATFVLDLAQVQFEVGTASSDYERRPLGLELALCQRYYEQSYPFGIVPGTVTQQGMVAGADTGTHIPALSTRFRVEKRGVPALNWYSPVTGAAGKVLWDASDRTVATFHHISAAGTGYPEVTTFVNSVVVAQAHWTADAEL